MSSEVKNLAALQAALDAHARECPWPPVEFRMNPFEVERLGWDDFKGLPIIGDPDMPTGRVRVVCVSPDDPEVIEAVADQEVLA